MNFPGLAYLIPIPQIPTVNNILVDMGETFTLSQRRAQIQRARDNSLLHWSWQVRQKRAATTPTADAFAICMKTEHETALNG